MSTPIICWFREDLRLADHNALTRAAEAGPVIAVYVLDDDAAGSWRAGGASRWWLHHSLAALGEAIAGTGGQLVLKRGAAAEVLAELADATGARGLYFSRGYEAWARAQEPAVFEALAERLEVKRFPGRLLLEPEHISTGSGDPYRVFTPFWKSARERVGDPEPRPVPEITWAAGAPVSKQLEDWGLTPSRPDWAGGLRESWTPGEAGALERLDTFLAGAVDTYASDRDRPDLVNTSRLSPHLRFGEISPRQVWRQVSKAASAGDIPESQGWAYLRELGWREFSYHLLYHYPSLPTDNFRDQFDRFDWRKDAADLKAWQRGQTGYPIVDAGMRELWHTGWMHNRVRMVVGSFLVKHLRLHWREGENWFWDTLVDADLANNSASWQWVAGSGADAAPYFRIFNPMTQGEKFDPQGAYVRRWVPELRALPDMFLNRPWEAPTNVLRDAGITLGETYPKPRVDHRQARESALAAFQALKAG
ncbi:MAG: deoxyribodipyrimidine photo-lyase [Pseudomonadota bacterium]